MTKMRGSTPPEPLWLHNALFVFVEDPHTGEIRHRWMDRGTLDQQQLAALNTDLDWLKGKLRGELRSGKRRLGGFAAGDPSGKTIFPDPLWCTSADFDIETNTVSGPGGLVLEAVRVFPPASGAVLPPLGLEAAAECQEAPDTCHPPFLARASAARRVGHQDVSVDRVVEWMTERLKEAKRQGRQMTALQIITTATAKSPTGMNCTRKRGREALAQVGEDLRPARGRRSLAKDNSAKKLGQETRH